MFHTQYEQLNVQSDHLLLAQQQVSSKQASAITLQTVLSYQPHSYPLSVLVPGQPLHDTYSIATNYTFVKFTNQASLCHVFQLAIRLRNDDHYGIGMVSYAFRVLLIVLCRKFRQILLKREQSRSRQWRGSFSHLSYSHPHFRLFLCDFRCYNTIFTIPQ